MDASTSRKELRRRGRRIADKDRKRALRACDRCKKRKHKCIETPDGLCQRCQTGGYHCSLVDGETASITAILSQHADSSGLMRLDPELDDHSGKTPVAMRQQQVDAVAADITLTTSDSSGLAGFLARLREAFCLEPQSVPEVGAARHQRYQSAPSNSPGERARAHAAFSKFPPLSISLFLVAVCVEHGTDCFFYFNQSRFTADLDDLYENPASRLRNDASFICLALAVFALGSQWTSLAKPSDGVSSPPLQTGDPGRVFYDQARLLMGDIIDSASLASVQAAFVLGVYLMPASAISAAYVYMGLALRKSMALDFHREVSDPTLGDADREVRRRLWWSVYSLERTLTVKLSRPQSVDGSQISVALPEACDYIDSSQKFNNLLLQIANAQLIEVLDDLSNHPPLDIEQRLAFEARLKEWKKSLPTALRRDKIHAKSSYYRATTHIYLNYYFAWIAMGKISVVTVARAHLDSALRPGQSPVVVDPDVAALAQSCIKPARKMLRLFDDLHNTGNLTRFSFTDFQGCSIATIVLLVAGLIPGEYDCQLVAAVGLDYLKLMAGKNATAQKGVHFVEAVRAIVAEATTKIRNNRTRSNEKSTPNVPPFDGSDYHQWAQWLTTASHSDTERNTHAAQPEMFQDGPRSSQNAGQGHISVPPTPPSVSGVTFPDATCNSLATKQAVSYEETLPQTSIGAALADQCDSILRSNATIPYDFPSIFEDDHEYLMGLTGLGVLDFAEPTDLDFQFDNPY
ncbi:hypothetical protein LTR78_010339 [Recurvomyces mirabilis]|uniref:Zn(2)-C6 fungal-type domain-containing protein n=1 Tax=Recurvomyces mirabilis TaxID=574656 RepID=A0AAE0TS98_9PEZI|nr:hypothetical protein LTR78_010339 [Recurvomyces mirabilis]KAK5156220.1 hypothetical protein LTS14_005107 [Recurvomyces mirabilis]